MDVLLRPKMCDITLRGLEGFFAFFLPSVVMVSEAVVQGFVNSQRGSGGVGFSGMVFVVVVGVRVWLWLCMDGYDIMDRMIPTENER